MTIERRRNPGISGSGGPQEGEQSLQKASLDHVWRCLGYCCFPLLVSNSKPSFEKYKDNYLF